MYLDIEVLVLGLPNRQVISHDAPNEPASQNWYMIFVPKFRQFSPASNLTVMTWGKWQNKIRTSLIIYSGFFAHRPPNPLVDTDPVLHTGSNLQSQGLKGPPPLWWWHAGYVYYGGCIAVINGGLISKWFKQFRIPGTIFRGSGKHTVENGFMVTSTCKC